MSKLTGDIILLILTGIYAMLCYQNKKWEPIPAQILTIAGVIVSGKLGEIAYQKWPARAAVKVPPP